MTGPPFILSSFLLQAPGPLAALNSFIYCSDLLIGDHETLTHILKRSSCSKFAFGRRPCRYQLLERQGPEVGISDVLIIVRGEYLFAAQRSHHISR